MRDSDICIRRFRLAVIWSIENITDMRRENVEEGNGQWSHFRRGQPENFTHINRTSIPDRSIADTYGAAVTK